MKSATPMRMLRDLAGFKPANDGWDRRNIQHYLGHKNIQHTACYKEVSVIRFKGFWTE